MQTYTQSAQPAQSAPSGTEVNASETSEMDDFIYLISHDVRASVRALLELPQWIKEDLEEAGVKMGGSVGTSIDLMNRHTGRLDRMLVDLLAYSRVGRMQTVQSMDIAEALDDVLDQIHMPSGFAVTRALNTPALTIGDRDLALMLSALMSNAAKHHDKPRGRIHISSETDAGQTVITVADDGPGIAEKYAQRVFAPMTTLRPRDEVEGSGMGLAQVQKIARHYGGDACLVRTPFGQGTAVEVRLPVRA